MIPASQIAHYRIIAKIGEGGMGAVFRATDTKLHRDVAIKVLPDAFAHDADRLSRFTREAQLLASLNHPNIASIFGVEERALILELVEGPTLEDRIARGPIPLDEAIPIARQIAEALEYAHDRNVIHRDLKPANIKVTSDGRVKVLDFGLAKALTPETSNSNPANSPTLTIGATSVGIIMGTAGYMSPEQAKGRPTDRRADIWAFGAVLTEMLTGKAIYKAETVSETLAQVLLQPPDLTSLPHSLPGSIRRLIVRCLHRDATLRLQHAGEARIVLQSVPEPEPENTKARQPTRRMFAAGAISGAAVTAAAAFGISRMRSSNSTAAPTVRFHVRAPFAGPALVALSPDGRQLAIANGLNSADGIWLRSLDSLEWKQVPGTAGATYPTWSPDGKSIAFFADRKLKRISISGPPVQVISDAPGGRGLAWGENGVILFCPTSRGGIHRTDPDGSSPVPVTAQPQDVNSSDRYPVMLPGGERFLYLHYESTPDQSGIFLGSLTGAKPVRISQDISNAVFLPGQGTDDGWLLFTRERALLAQRFSAAGPRLYGEVFQLATRVSSSGNSNFYGFSASSTGAIAVNSYSVSARRRLSWVDRNGKRLESVAGPEPIASFALSPDEKQIALILRTSFTNRDIWVKDVNRQNSTRLTFDENVDTFGLTWTPDGRHVVYSVRGLMGSAVYRKASDGSSKEELLLQYAFQTFPTDWSSDGKFLALQSAESGVPNSYLLSPGEKPRPFAPPPTTARLLKFSGDARWVVYEATDANERRVYVQPVASSAAKWQLASGVGGEPTWRRDGREIYYISGESKLMAVPVDTASGTFHAGAAKALFDLMPSGTGTYQPSADGQKFLCSLLDGNEPDVAPIEVILNWSAK